jgi:hypothetical protein
MCLKYPVSGHSRQHFAVAVAVDARWQHQDGEAERRQRPVSTPTGFVALVEQPIGIEFAQQFQRER